MKMINQANGKALNIKGFFMTKNMWEYFIIDEPQHDKNIVTCLVDGFEMEIGDVYLPEVKPFIITKIVDVNKCAPEDMPAPARGYMWDVPSEDDQNEDVPPTRAQIIDELMEGIAFEDDRTIERARSNFEAMTLKELLDARAEVIGA